MNVTFYVISKEQCTILPVMYEWLYAGMHPCMKENPLNTGLQNICDNYLYSLWTLVTSRGVLTFKNLILGPNLEKQKSKATFEFWAPKWDFLGPKPQIWTPILICGTSNRRIQSKLPEMKKNSAKKFFSLLNIQILLGALTNSEGLNSEVGFQNQLQENIQAGTNFSLLSRIRWIEFFNPWVYKSQFRTHMPRYSFCVPSFFHPWQVALYIFYFYTAWVKKYLV